MQNVINFDPMSTVLSIFPLLLLNWKTAYVRSQPVELDILLL
jgi:hypothetical protein